MEIRAIASNERSVVDEVVDIHLATFTGFFLTFMGRGFLRHMYRSYCDHSPSGLLVAFEEDRAIGFLAYSEDMSGLYRFMIKKRLIPFAWYSLGAFLRKPRVFMRLIRAFLKPSESQREEAYVELSSIGVAPDIKAHGVGSALIDALKGRLDLDRFAYIGLETDAEDNEGANHFYQKNGFLLVRNYKTREGRSMNEYRYRRESE